MSTPTVNLSLDQAPPIAIPLRFFLTAPVLGLFAAVLGLLVGPELYSSRWNPFTLAITHLLTLGFMAQIMCGAIFQMLPVIIGAPVSHVTRVAALTHPLLTAGILLLAVSLLFTDRYWALLASVTLATGFILYLSATGLALWRNRSTNPTFIGLALALFSLLLTLTLGLLLLAAYRDWLVLPSINILTDVHLSWGLFGWIGLLLISIAYQVVPMFQVTPEYPVWIKKGLVPWLFCSLLLWSGLQLLQLFSSIPRYPILLVLTQLAALGGFAVFCITTLHLQSQRKRRVADVTLLFWKLAIYSALLAVSLWLLAQLLPAWANSREYPLLLGVLLLPGFGCSVMNGMLYKIVPFLSWFHLQNRQLALLRTDVRLPNMKQFISDARAKWQLWVHAAAMLAAATAVFWAQWLSYAAAGLFGFSWWLLGLNLVTALRHYHACCQQLTTSNRLTSESPGSRRDSDQ